MIIKILAFHWVLINSCVGEVKLVSGLLIKLNLILLKTLTFLSLFACFNLLSLYSNILRIMSILRYENNSYKI